jgi:hypothetical protein
MTYPDDSRRTTTMEPPASPTTRVPLGTGHAEAGEAAYKADRRKTGIRDIIGGAVLILIGFAYGGSIFMGTADVIDWAFDLLGTFWLVKGLYLLFT